MQLLTKPTSNAKLAKSKDYGYASFGMHLAPFDLSGYNTCKSASKGCAGACLNTAGMGAYSTVQTARIKKTQWFFNERELFLANLHREIGNKIKTSKRKNENISFRLNLTSDLNWESIKYKGKSFMEHFPDVQFMDYTKHFKRMLRYLNGQLPSNYHLTFSRSEENEDECKIVIACGGNVAIVFRNELPNTYLGKKVIDGDKNDLRFLDPKNCIVGLVSKGKARKENSGFVVEVC